MSSRKGERDGFARRKHLQNLVAADPHCYWCGRYVRKNPPGRVLQLPHTATRDHVIPLGEGGRDIDENVVLACYPCNQRRAQEDNPPFSRAQMNSPFDMRAWCIEMGILDD